MNTYKCGIHLNVVSYSKCNILVNMKMYFIEDDKIISFSFLHPYLADEKHRRKCPESSSSHCWFSLGQRTNKSKVHLNQGSPNPGP